MLGHQGCHVVPRASVDERLIRFRVVALVVHEGEVLNVAHDALHPLADGGQGVWKLLGIDDITFVHLRIERNLAVPGHQQGEAKLTEVGPFLLGVAALGQDGAFIAAGDVGKEIVVS